MPWMAGTSLAGATSNVAKLFWFRPDAAVIADFREVSLPSGVNGVKLKPTWATGPRHKYGAGGWTHNMIFTDDFAFWSLGIRAPTVVPTVVLAAGPGITANVICYLTYYDERTDEHSPLSAGSATLVASNQSITWSALPTPINPRITHIGLWRSVDGSLPRLVMLRQVGATTVTEAVTTADLGEAFVDTFSLFPRCRYAVEWHERLVLAGDDEHPDTLYLSLIDDREKQSLSLRTKSGQPIIGLINVRGTLIVLCPRATEIVTGWTEDDIAIEIAQPQIGCISVHGVQIIHGLAWIPTHLGLYVCNGSEWFYVGDDVQSKWIDEYRLRRDAYEKGWGVHDPVSMTYKFYVGAHTDTGGLNTYWCADYTPVTPQTGGGYGQPNWSYDVSGRQYCSSTILAVPGGRRVDTYTGSHAGLIYKENNTADGSDQGDIFAKRMTIRWGAHQYNDYGGDLAQGKRFTDLDMFVKAEKNVWTLNVYCGDEYAYPAIAPSFTKVNSASQFINLGHQYQPKTVHHFLMPYAVGRTAMVEIVAVNPTEMEVMGYQINWKEGPAYRGRAIISDPG